jgi:hypothetical protein
MMQPSMQLGPNAGPIRRHVAATAQLPGKTEIMHASMPLFVPIPLFVTSVSYVLRCSRLQTNIPQRTSTYIALHSVSRAIGLDLYGGVVMY